MFFLVRNLSIVVSETAEISQDFSKENLKKSQNSICFAVNNSYFFLSEMAYIPIMKELDDLQEFHLLKNIN